MSYIALWGRSLLAWAAALAMLGAVDDWPQWRGPRRDGQIVGFKAPATWPTELQKQWQIEVGEGHSSPLVVDGKVYLFARRDEKETLTCFDLADGKQLWRQSYPAPYEVNSVAAAHGKGPKSTPALADGRVFTLGISGILSCFDARTGRLRWRQDFAKQFEKTSPACGTAMSPLVEDDKCIVNLGGPEKGSLVAVDVKSGAIAWSCQEDAPGYASPVIATLDDERQVITQTQKAVIGVRVDDGKLLWKIPFVTEYDQNIVTPLVHEGSVIVSGYNKGIDRYRVERQEGRWEADKVWENKDVSLYMSSPVADAERLFGFSHKHKGELFAIDLTTGKTLWTSEGRLGENAHVVQAGNVLLALTDEAELIVFRASDKRFQQLARYKMANTPTWAHPLLMARGILVKDEHSLALWQLPNAPTADAPTAESATGKSPKDKASTGKSSTAKATTAKAAKTKSP